MLQKTLKGTLLASCALVGPEIAIAQQAAQQDTGGTETIIVSGRYIPNEKRATSENLKRCEFQ